MRFNNLNVIKKMHIDKCFLINRVDYFVLFFMMLCFSPLHAVEKPLAEMENITLKINKIRNYAVHTGDVVELSYQIRSSVDNRIIESSLPVKGSINYWLDFIHYEIEENISNGHALYNVKLVYQIFYAPLDIHKLSIPTLKLQFTSKEGVVEKILPEWN